MTASAAQPILNSAHSRERKVEHKTVSTSAKVKENLASMIKKHKFFSRDITGTFVLKNFNEIVQL